ncbi:MAG: hypothetical protein AB2L14_13685 [Candidatus Xenobiia bacterium LiM19]
MAFPAKRAAQLTVEQAGAIEEPALGELAGKIAEIHHNEDEIPTYLSVLVDYLTILQAQGEISREADPVQQYVRFISGMAFLMEKINTLQF